MIKDRMFISSFNIGVSVFVTIPLCLFVPVVLLWVFVGFWWAFGYFVAFPLMFVLAWNYMRMFRKFVGTLRFISERAKVKELRKLRKSIFARLDDMLA